MKLSKVGRIVSALVATAALGLGMTACGGGTIGYMYVVGTFYNQISAFQIDDYTGNLTGVPQSPFSSGGQAPVQVLVNRGGRFIYVINSGSAATAPTATTPATQSVPGTIAEFSVGGQGTLTFQQSFTSAGTHPVWATFDGTGSVLYVLDQYAPDLTGNGSISAFNIASDTGRLSILTNQGIKNPNGTPTTYFPTGRNPIMTKLGTNNCLYTLSAQSIFADVVAGNGQLTLAPSGAVYTVGGAQNLTSINSAGSYIFLTDGGANQIYTLQGASGCSLASVTASQQNNLPGTANPVNSVTTQDGNFLYVINQSSTGNPISTTNSSISAFHINTNGQLQQVTDQSNPYPTGSGPVCVVQDPSKQYLYTSNNTDSTVTGKIIRQDNGILSPLQRGSVFPTTMKPTCLAVTGSL